MVSRANGPLTQMLLQDNGIIDLEFGFLQVFTTFTFRDSGIPSMGLSQRYEDFGLFSGNFLHYLFYRTFNVLLFVGGFVLIWIVIKLMLLSKHLK